MNVRGHLVAMLLINVIINLLFCRQKIRDFFWKHGCVSKRVEFSAFTERLPGRKAAIASRTWFTDKQPENRSRWVIACGGSHFVHSTYGRQEKEHFLGFSTHSRSNLLTRIRELSARYSMSQMDILYLSLHAFMIRLTDVEIRDQHDVWWSRNARRILAESLDLIPEVNRFLC